MLGPAISLGTFTAGRFAFLGYAPPDGNAFFATAAHIVAGTAIQPSTTDYWSIGIGTMKGGVFTPKVDIPLNVGIPATPTRKPFRSRVAINRGEMLVARVSKFGTPATLQDVSLALECAILPGGR